MTLEQKLETVAQKRAELLGAEDTFTYNGYRTLANGTYEILSKTNSSWLRAFVLNEADLDDAEPIVLSLESEIVEVPVLARTGLATHVVLFVDETFETSEDAMTGVLGMIGHQSL